MKFHNFCIISDFILACIFKIKLVVGIEMGASFYFYFYLPSSLILQSSTYVYIQFFVLRNFIRYNSWHQKLPPQAAPHRTHCFQNPVQICEYNSLRVIQDYHPMGKATMCPLEQLQTTEIFAIPHCRLNFGVEVF